LGKELIVCERSGIATGSRLGWQSVGGVAGQWAIHKKREKVEIVWKTDYLRAVGYRPGCRLGFTSDILISSISRWGGWAMSNTQKEREGRDEEHVLNSTEYKNQNPQGGSASPLRRMRTCPAAADKNAGWVGLLKWFVLEGGLPLKILLGLTKSKHGTSQTSSGHPDAFPHSTSSFRIRNDLGEIQSSFGTL